MRKAILALVCVLATSYAGATTVTGNLKDFGVNNVTSPSTFVRFTLEGYGSIMPRVTSTSVIAKPYYDFQPDASGNISGSIQGNDTISAGTDPAGGTWYQVCIYYQGQQFLCNAFSIAASMLSRPVAFTNSGEIPT